MPRRSRGTVRPGHHQRERQACPRETHVSGRPNGLRQKCELMCVRAARVLLLYASGNGEHAPHLVRTDGIGIIRGTEEVDVEHHGLSGARSTTHRALRRAEKQVFGSPVKSPANDQCSFGGTREPWHHTPIDHHHTCHRTVVLPTSSTVRSACQASA
jgi:hypothetical protein